MKRSKTLMGLMMLGLAGFATSARASIAVEQACSMGAARADLGAGANQTVQAAETILASNAADRGDRALTMLRDPRLFTTGSPGDVRVAARYCAALGEASRLARTGSMPEARRLLLASFRMADQARDPGTSALAAFRVGLSGVDRTPGENARGARRAGAKEEQDAEAVLQACAPLRADDPLSREDLVVTVSALECAAARAAADGDMALAARANLVLARLELSLAGREKIVEAALRADAQDRLMLVADQGAKLADPVMRGEITLRAIETLLDMSVRDERLASTLRQLESATSGHPGLEAYRLAMLGRLAALNGDRAGARRMLERAIFFESQQTQPLRLSTWYLLLADQDERNREGHVFAAYRALELVRPLIPRDDPITQEPNFQLRMRDVFVNAAQVSLSGDAADQKSIDRAQDIIEHYRQAELQSIFGSECVPSREPLQPAELSAGEVLVYPVLLADRVELIYAIGGSGRGYQRLAPNTASNRAEVSALVQTFVDSASSGGSQWREPARRLYDVLLKPLAPQIPDGATLVIVPDGPLRSLPFSALVDETGHFLIEKFRVSVAPALGYVEPGVAFRHTRPEVLALSLSKEVDLPAGFFPPLSGTAEEARAAAGTDGMLVANFHKADLEQAMSRRRIDILHFATHASFNGRADRAFIVADQEAISLSELREIIADNQLRGDRLNLLVLSACETAVGDDQASMGLAGAAVQASARSAVASLWQVNDVGTVRLMQNFYRNLRNGEGKAEALRSAQIELLRSGADFADPNIWSAFILVGGWR